MAKDFDTRTHEDKVAAENDTINNITTLEGLKAYLKKLRLQLKY